MRSAGAISLALLLAGCVEPRYPVTRPPPSEAAPARPQPPPRRSPVRPPVRTPPAPAPDQCGARAQQRLVGRPRTEIPIPLEPNKQRVACTTCPVTLDYRPERLNFFFDAKAGIIKEVRCG